MITTEQKQWTQQNGWKTAGVNDLKSTPQLVLVFGASTLVKQQSIFEEIKKMYPESHILMCSTAGEILGTQVTDNSLSLTAISFEKTVLEFSKTSDVSTEKSEEVGLILAQRLPKKGLVHTMVFSDGLNINGTALVKGLQESLPVNVSVTGGLVGDGADFKNTYVGLDEHAQEKEVVLIGFYGEGLKIGYGSMGGWDSFGPERTITKSEGNVLYELDNSSALDLYKKYLGDKASELPGSGLLFPLSLRIPSEKGETNVVRTLLAVDDQQKSMTFAGDMPQGSKAKLMKANFERLVDGASGAASMSITGMHGENPQLSILVSCIGRKLVLKERVEDELEAVKGLVGASAMCGFYSYGEISPTSPTEKQCQLHNQTMTITTMIEA